MSRISNQSFKVNAALEQLVEISNSTAIPVSEASDIQKWGSVATSQGQKLSASSIPVVLASDQTDVPVTVSGVPNVDIQSVGGLLIGLGQNVSNDSFPVVIASDQSSLPVTMTSSNNGFEGNLDFATSVLSGDFSSEVDTSSAKNITITGVTTDIGSNPIELWVAHTSAGTKYRFSYDIYPDSSGHFSQALENVAVGYLYLKYTVAATVTATALSN